jgi:hypothetical protein
MSQRVSNVFKVPGALWGNAFIDVDPIEHVRVHDLE